MRIIHLVNLLLLIGGVMSCSKSKVEGQTEPQSVSEKPAQTREQALYAKAKQIHERVITIDTHIDINSDDFTAERNYTMDLDNQINLPKMARGGLDVAWLVVYTTQREHTTAGYAAALDKALQRFAAIHRLVEVYAPKRVELALNAKDVRRIHAAGKKAVMIGVENGYPIGTDLTNVNRFHDLGARYISLSHNGHSQLSDANTGEEDGVWLHNGLSALGKQVVREMNKWGLMVDVSHPSRKAMLDMLAVSRAPIFASHSAARALNDHSRNLDDEQLKLIRQCGGVVQVVSLSYYLNKEKSIAHRKAVQRIYREIADEMRFQMLSWRERQKLSSAAQSQYRQTMRKVRETAKPRILAEVDPITPPVTLKDFVDHIDYIVDLIGIDHVGIGSDFGGGGGVRGYDDVSESFNVTLELVKRGYTEEAIAKLWGENLLRVLDEVQRIAQKIQKEISR